MGNKIVRFAKWILEMDKLEKINEKSSLWIDVDDDIDEAMVAYLDEDNDLIISEDEKNAQGSEDVFNF